MRILYDYLCRVVLDRQVLVITAAWLAVYFGINLLLQLGGRWTTYALALFFSYSIGVLLYRLIVSLQPDHKRP